MDAWLRRKLIDDGTMTEDGVTKRARQRHHVCGMLVLAGIDDLSIEAIADPWPVTVADELAALLAGRCTWTLIGEEMVYRAAHRIRYRNADEEPAYVEHICGVRAYPQNPRHKKPRTRARSDNPPF